MAWGQADKKARARLDHTREAYKETERRALENAGKVEEIVQRYAPQGKTTKNTKNTGENWLKTVAMVAQMGEVLADDNIKAKNDWKARMLKAGLENHGLIMPDDWDDLSEVEKQRRLDGAIDAIK